MKRTFLIFFLSVCTLFLGLTAKGQAVHITTQCDTLGEIGDQLELKLSFTTPKSTRVIFPIIPDSILSTMEFFPSYESYDSLTEVGKGITYSKRYIFTIFKKGVYTLPALEFISPLKSSTDTSSTYYQTLAVSITIHAPAVDTTQAIKDIKEIMKIPYTFKEIAPYVGMGVGSLLLIAFIIYAIYRYMHKKPIFVLPQKVQTPADILALKQMDILKNKKLWQQNFTKEYYTELTDILRVYIQNYLHIQAVEITSEELLELYKKSDIYEIETYRLLETILPLSDTVKFAKNIPLFNENELCFTQALSFIETTRQKVEKMKVI